MKFLKYTNEVSVKIKNLPVIFLSGWIVTILFYQKTNF